MQDPTTRDCLRGALYVFSAVCIWAGLIVVSRLTVQTSLTPWDVAAIRFSGAGLPWITGRSMTAIVAVALAIQDLPRRGRG